MHDIPTESKALAMHQLHCTVLEPEAATAHMKLQPCGTLGHAQLGFRLCGLGNLDAEMPVQSSKHRAECQQGVRR